MKYFVYLVESSKDSYFYTGITSNLDRRLQDHNSGKLSNTARHRPYQLVWFKKYASYSEARRHEKWLKKKNKKYKLHLKEIAQLAPPSSGGVK